MAKSGTLTVRVVADTRAAEQQLGRFGNTVESTGDKMQSAGRKLTAFATIPVAAAMGVATKAASDLQQAVGGTEAVFGDAAKSIDRYAKTAAASSGLSEREFREATTSIGGQLKRMTGDVDLAAERSIELTQVAADLAATYGGTTAEAVAALGSAFRGEADPAERFNLNLKVSAVNAKAVEMGLAATTSEVDDNARAQATLALIMEQSADAQGQFARESDSAAGSMQIAKAEMENASAQIGASLLPLVAKAAGGVADLAQNFSELPEPVQNGILALAGFVAAAGPVLSVTGKIINGLRAIDTAGVSAAAGLKRIGPAAAGIGTAAAVIALAAATTEDFDDKLKQLRETAGDTDDEFNSLSEAFEQDSGKIGEHTNALILDRLAALDLTGVLADAGVTLDEYTDALRRAADAGNDQEARLAATADVSRKVANEVGGTSAEFIEFSTATGVLAEQLGRAESRFKDTEKVAGDLGNTSEDTAPKVEDLGDANQSAAEKAEEFEDRIKGVTDALRAQIDPLFAAQDAMLGHKDAQDALKDAQFEAMEAHTAMTEAIAEHGRRSPEAAQAWIDYEAAQRKVIEADRDVVRSAGDTRVAMEELNARVKENPSLLSDAEAALREWVDQGLITEQQAWDTAVQLKSLVNHAKEAQGVSIYIPVRLDTTQWLKDIAAFYEQNPMIPVSFGLGGQQTYGERHTGGPISANNAYIVKGGEAIVSGVDGYVMTPQATQRAMSSGASGHNITIHNHYPKPEPASEGSARAMRKLQYAVGL